MMAITTSNSIRVNPERRRFNRGEETRLKEDSFRQITKINFMGNSQFVTCGAVNKRGELCNRKDH